MSGFTRARLPVLLVAAVLGLVATANASIRVVIGWDANPAAENVTGYRLHWGNVSRQAPGFSGFDHEQDVGNVTESAVDLPDGTTRCFFSVSAYNAAGLASDYSDELGVVVVTVAAAAGGSVSPSGTVVVKIGGSLDLVLTPDEGFEVEAIDIDGVSAGAATTYTLNPIDAPCDVLARFAAVSEPWVQPAQPAQSDRKYAVSLSAGANGTMLPNATVAVTETASLTFTVLPDTGYSIADVVVDGASVGAVSRYTLRNVTADHAISASFVPNRYTAVVSAGQGGSVSPSGSVSIEHGGSLTVNITPDTGYAVADVMVDGASVGAVNPYTLRNVTAAHAISASFVRNRYTVAVRAGLGGSISSNGSVSIDHGGSLTVSVTPDSGYEVVSVLVNGVNVGPVSAYTISDIGDDTVVSALFHATDTGFADTDGDQLPDAWEIEYFAGQDVDPEADSDGDGRSNYQEYLVDTDPTVAELDPALTPAVVEPISGATVVSLRPALVVNNPPNWSGPLTYEFEIALESTMLSPTVSVEDVQQGTLGVAWTPQGGIDDQTRYYWRARAVTDVAASPWTPVNTFFVDIGASPTTTELIAAEYISADADLLVEILNPDTELGGLGVNVFAATLPYDFVLTISTVSHPPVSRSTTRLAGKVVEFGPHGRFFDQQVTILLPYTDQIIEEAGVASAGELDVLTYNTETLAWEPIPEVVTDYAGQRFIARVDHFSMYSVGVTDVEPPVTVPVSSDGKGCFINSLW